MTFTSTIKEEITKLEGNRLEYIAELSAILRQ
jgi:DNA-binding transcriptional regulator WhiA